MNERINTTIIGFTGFSLINLSGIVSEFLQSFGNIELNTVDTTLKIIISSLTIFLLLKPRKNDKEHK